jgi:tetratricopeptide (TPR) repeat protein
MKKNYFLKLILIGVFGTLLPILFIIISSMVIYGANFPLLKFYYWQGFYEQRIGNFSEAIKFYDKANQLDSTHATTYISRGSAYLDLKNFNKAILNYTKAINLDKNNEEPYAYRGRAFYEIDSLSKAKADFDKALKLNPKFAYAYTNRALLKYTKLNDQKGGCDDLKKAEKLGDEIAKEHLKEGVCD